MPSLLVAWLAAPNTWDSMTYHLSRVKHWIDNETVAFYPTHILRQLHSGPMAEYQILQAMLITGTDGAANFIQFQAYCICVLGVWRIAELLGGDSRAKLLAATAMATLPPAVLQSTSTKNDLVVASFVLAFIVFAIRNSWLLTGCALGLALLTKATAWIYLAPAGLAVTVLLLRRRGAAGLQNLAVILGIAALINVPQWSRNYSLSGNPIGAMREGPDLGYLNESHHLKDLAGNAVRNLALHAATGNRKIDAAILRTVEGFHRFLEIDPRDPRTSWHGRSLIMASSRHEDTGGALVWMVLSVAGAVAALVRARPTVRWYCAGVFVAAALFVTLLKWQPWHTRLHIPLFAVVFPAAAIGIASLANRRIVLALVAVLIVGALPFTLFNETRPLIGERSVLLVPRTSQYFSARPILERPYIEAMNAARRCDTIGLVTAGDGWEYPLWALAGRASTVEHVAVTNASADFAPPIRVAPCAIVITAADPRPSVEWDGRPYDRAYASPVLSLFIAR
jgi:hypothetical protein